MTLLTCFTIELCRVIDGYKLPFDMHNSVLLVRSDLALSSVSFVIIWLLVIYN